MSCSTYLYFLEGHYSAKFSFDSLISDHLKVGENITIKSTGFPSRYFSSLLETWLFTSESGFLVKFTFFETEQGADIVTITNGPNNVSVTPITFSGNIDPNSSYIFSSDNRLNVTFATNFGIEYRGFHAVIIGFNMSSVRKYIYELFLS